MQSKELSVLLAVWLSVLALVKVDGATTSQPNVNATVAPEFSLGVKHNESSTSSIKITWDVTLDERQIYHFRVQSRKLDRSDIIRSPPLPHNSREYVIQDLTIHSNYEICVYAHFRNDTDEESEMKCENFATLAPIRPDSILGLFIALGYILLMIILGYIVWRYHKYRQEKNAEEEGSEAGSEPEEEKLNPQDNPGLYLEPPSGKAPRSSIEDENIPYITPPVDQLSDEEKEQYQKSTLV